MKKGIYLSLLLFSLFIGINNVNAAFNYWANDVDLHGNILYWTGSNRLNFDSNTNDLNIYSPFYDDLDGSRINYSATTIVDGDTYLSSNATANVPYGIGVQYNFIKNQVYSLNYYVCFTNGYFDNWNTSSGGLNDVVSGSTAYTKYSYITRGSLLKLPYSNTHVGKYSECQLYSQAFVPTENIPWLGIWFMPKVNSQVDIFGFDIEMGGVYAENSNDDLSNQIIEMNNSITNEQKETNNKLDDIKDMDIDDSEKELPDDSKYQDYQDSENSLKDKVNQADLNYLEIGMDDKSSLFIWDVITRVIQSHPVVFAMVTSILSIGIIKLALGR